MGYIYWDCWALVWPDGRIVVDTNAGGSQDSAWRIGLGWPDAIEIQHAKSNGVRCVPVKIRALEAPNNQANSVAEGDPVSGANEG